MEDMTGKKGKAKPKPRKYRIDCTSEENAVTISYWRPKREADQDG
jgi:hypothetical protein